MSEQSQSLVAQWNSLKNQAESGELKLDPEIGNALKGHADQMKTTLSQLLISARQLNELSGFGTLRTATTMQQKLENKADSGDASATQRLRESIQVLTLMAETYEKAIRTIEDTDQRNSQEIANTETGNK